MSVSSNLIVVFAFKNGFVKTIKSAGMRTYSNVVALESRISVLKEE